MQDNKLTWKGSIVWGVCAIFFLYEFFLRTVVGTYQMSIMSDLSLSSLEFSLLSTTIFLLIYGLMQLPVGIIISHIGLKKSLLIACYSCCLSSIGFSSVDGYIAAFIYRIIMGFGAAFGFICLLISVDEWMPRRYIAIFIGISQFIGTMGPMLSAGPLESLSEYYEMSWRVLFLFLGLIGFLISFLVLAFVKNNNEIAGRYIILKQPSKLSDLIKVLFSKLQPWYIAMISTSLYFAIEYLSENEGRSFLNSKGLDTTSSSYIITIAWLGYAFGCPFFGIISDLIERRKVIFVVCGFLNLLSIILILYYPGVEWIGILFFILGISAGGQSIGFANITEYFKPQYVSIGFGLNNALITIFVSIGAPLLGYFLDSIASKNIKLTDYVLVFNFLIGISFIALFVSIFCIRETFCKSTRAFTVLKSS